MVLKVCLLVMLCQVLALGQELNYVGWPTQATTATTKPTTTKGTTSGGSSSTISGGGTGTTSSSTVTRTTSSGGVIGTTSSGGGTGTTSSGGGTGTTSSGDGTGTTSSGGTTPTSCLPSKYRNVEGLCGNPSVPSWGRANEPFARLVPSFYADGISSAAVMSNGAAYANVRNISFFLFGIDEPADTTRTLLNIYFLQAITNDLADTSSKTTNVCCSNGQVVPNAPEGCYPVVIADNDPLYSWFNIKCLEYSRVSTAPQTNPPQAVRQINRATSYLDLSFLYGTSSVQNPSRITTGGRLLSVRRDGLEFPVLDPAGCTSPLQDVCYLVADSRSYQSPMSAIVHLLFFREHNRIAVQLKTLNPSWSDLTLYEEARRINIAQYQRIVYYELLPKILGRTNMVNNRLLYESSGFVNDYDASQNPASIAEFANVVASFLNSQLPGAINFVVNGTIQSKELSSLYPKLQSLESDFATIFAAMSSQLARVVDTSFTIEWKNFMYRGNAPLGLDLLAIDLQKMRDFGFAPYNFYRARCGLSIFTSWEAYSATIKASYENTIQKIQAIYPTVNDMELFVGAAFEAPLPGAVFGPTFSCIMTQQFLRARTGDRYFFETGAQEGSFTATQVTEIRKISLARMMCNALPTIANVQADVLSPAGPTNPLVSCNSLPAVNLAAWISAGGTGTTSSTGVTATTSSSTVTRTTSSGGVTGTTSSGGGTGTTSSGGTTPTSCLPSKYRNVEGLCGNPSASSWGRANEPFARLVPSFYADGISSPAVMNNGSAYASVRNISFFLFGIDELADTTRTMLNIYFLQAITNDLADTSSNTNNVCCTNGQVVSNAPDGCYPVVIGDDDPLYSWFNIKCLEYSRVSTAPQTNPPQAVRQINRATSYLDLSFLYGTSSVQNPSRITTGGRLLSVRRDGLEFPVLDPAGCTSPLQDVCYLVADSRSYQSPMSAIVHLLFFREHNRIAVQLKTLNPSWSDLTLYEEARRINIAQYQRIVYYELLPKILGRTNMVNNRLLYESSGFVNDYDASQNPASIAEFANVVASFLNSQLPGAINFVVNGTIQSKELSSLYPKLQSLESDFATIFAAMSSQLARVVDTSFTIEWKNFMYRGNAPLGLDLLAIDLQKMRDFGFAPYNFYRARCGLSIFTSWEEYNATMKAPCEKTIQKIQAIYPTVNDMELFVGAAFEAPLPGAVFGPTFSCIMTQQFLRARTGDRYFFETGAQEGSFTATQLTEIRKISLARMMCNALPTIANVQADVLSPAGPTNPLVSCNSLPAVNLAAWISAGGTGTTSSTGVTATTSSSTVTRTTSSGGVTGTTLSGGITGTTSSGGGTGTTSSGGTTPTSCLPSKYRNVEGLCGNPSASSWGRANEPFARLVPSFYADGISSPAVMSNGATFASVRNISFFLFGIDETTDTTRTLLNIYFLQAITNDLADTSSNTNNVCCTNGQVVPNAPEGCYPVVIGDDDPLYSWFNIKCLEYSRVTTAPQTNPPQAVRQINRATSYLDLSFLYGTSSVQKPSRITTGGRLLSVRRQGIEFPVIDPAGCTSPLQDVCYLVADSRSYQSPMSAIVHLLFFREHNRLALQLKLLNPSWSDLTLYEEARRINIAQYQRIVYYELLPKILGRTNMVNNRLLYESSGFVNDYDASQNPASIAEFASVVASFLNSQLPGAINFVVNGTIQSKALSSLYPKLQSLESDFATLFSAMSSQLTRLVDTSFTIEWKNFMYRGSAPLGLDLLAIDLQKMRDFGFASYNSYRSRCGLNTFTSWEEYNATMKAPCEKTIQKIQAIYPTVNDMELFVGAAFEAPLPGAVFGPTFSCIMTQQFLRARTGDRYFFETGAQEGSFTATQLTEIRKISLARLMCSALPTIGNVQADVLSPVGPNNLVVSCNSLPAVNLAAWAA